MRHIQLSLILIKKINLKDNKQIWVLVNLLIYFIWCKNGLNYALVVVQSIADWRGSLEQRPKPTQASKYMWAQAAHLFPAAGIRTHQGFQQNN